MDYSDAESPFDLSIIIVNFNTKDLLRQCLRSINNSKIDVKYEVIVVDNASKDGSVTMVSNDFPKVKLLSSVTNLGFGRGNNYGAEHAKGRNLLFLNPDTIVMSRSLDLMTNFLDNHPHTGAVGAQLLNTDGTVQLSCRRFYTPMSIIARRTPLGKLYPFSKSLSQHLMMDWDHKTLKEVDWMLAACLMIRKGLFKEVGSFDIRYVMYFEDVDICYRMKKRGYSVYYLPDAKIIHIHRRESARRFGRKTIWHISSAFKFFTKHGLCLISPPSADSHHEEP